MAVKLTIQCKEENIEFAKRYAKENHTSISKIVDDVFEALRSKKDEKADAFVQEFSGIIDLQGKSYKNILPGMIERRKRAKSKK